MPAGAADAAARRLRVPAQRRAPAAVPRRRADADAAARRRRARRAGAGDRRRRHATAFDALLGGHRGAVAAHFAAIFGTDAPRTARDAAAASTPTRAGRRSPAPRPRTDRCTDALAAVWRGDVARDTALATLAAAGFDDPAALADGLERVKAGARYLACRRCRGSASTRWCRNCSPSPPRRRRGRRRRRRRAASAQAVFLRLLALLETVTRRSAYLALLIEHPPMLPRLAQLMGASAWAAEYLNRHPILLDELLDARVLLAEPDWDAWRRELARLLADQDGDPEEADGRAAPFPARAGVPPARAGPRRDADASSASPTTSRRSPTSSSRPRSPTVLAHLCGTGRAAAAVRDRRLRQARRQGAGLRVRPRPRVPVRREATTTTRRRSATRGSRGASSPGSPAPPPRASSTTPTCACVPTAPPG